MKKRVLITGAAGTVGSALWQAWEKQDVYTLTLMDINPIAGGKLAYGAGRHSRLRRDARLVSRSRCVGTSRLCTPRFAREGCRVKSATSVHQ